MGFLSAISSLGTIIKAKTTNLSTIKKVLTMLLLTPLMLSPSIAMAADLFTPVSGDLSVVMLKKIFGGLMGGGADPLLDLITTFNSAVLIVGGVLVAYTIFAGSIGTAHDAEMLGKKFSSVWIPIRTAMGTALVIPVNGYCGMQMLVMWLVLQGIGMADKVWTSVATGPAMMNGTITAITPPPGVEALAKDIFKASICTVAARKDNEIMVADGMEVNHNWSKYDKTVSGKNYIYFGATNKPSEDGACGKIALIDETTKSTGVASNSDFSGVQGKIKAQGDTAQIIASQNSAVKAMASSLFAQAEQLVTVQDLGNGNKKVVSDVSRYSDTALTSAIETYNQQVVASTQALYQQASSSAHMQQMVQDGWIMAGAWFIKQMNTMSLANTALSTVPVAVSSTGISRQMPTQEVNAAMGNIFPKIDGYKYTKNSRIGTLDNGLHAYNEENKDSTSFTAKIAQFLGSLITGIELDKIAAQQNVHPIMQAKMMGDSMVTGGFTAFLAIVGGFALLGGSAAAAGGAFGIITGTSAGFSTAAISTAVFIAPLAFTIFGAIITTGFFLSYYIPMLPFLIWLGCLIGWFILVMEAVIAAPLWAVMHLHPNGDDVTGRGGQGYMLVLGLLVRPTLMIFGLICALILSGVLGQFINAVFYDVFKLSRMGESIGFMGVIFGYIIYTTMFVTFVNKMFSIIHVIPDQLLKWIGGGQEQLGQYAGQMIQGTEGQFMKAGGVLGAIASQGTNQGLATMQRQQQSRIAKGNEKAQEKRHEESQLSNGARDLGMSPTDITGGGAGGGSGFISSEDLAEAGGNKTKAGISALSRIQDAARQIASSGGDSGDRATFINRAQDYMSGAAGPQKDGSPHTPQSAMAAAMNDFRDDKFGKGAGETIAAVGNGSTNKEATASSRLALAQSRLPPSEFQNMMSDLNTAIGAKGDMSTISNSKFNEPAVAQSIGSYKSSSGATYETAQGGHRNAIAMNAVMSAYGVSTSSGNSGNTTGQSTGGGQDEQEGNAPAQQTSLGGDQDGTAAIKQDV